MFKLPQYQTAESQDQRIQPLPQPESPQEVMSSKNHFLRDIASQIRISLREGEPAKNRLVPMYSLSETSFYLCRPSFDDGQETDSPSWWLPPNTWRYSLTEFAAFTKPYGNESLRMLVEHHSQEPTNEFVAITPVRRIRDDYYSFSNCTYGLSPAGKLSFNPSRGLTHDLGYLNPKRNIEEIFNKNQASMSKSNPWVNSEEGWKKFIEG